MDKAALHTLIRSFLAEDVGRGDLTSESIFDQDQTGCARIVARESFVVAGGKSVAAEVFWVQNPAIVVEDLVAEGVKVNAGEYVVLTISDNGTGIPEHTLSKIFEPFYSKKEIGRSGTGLGLAIVWSTVHDHHGYVNLQSDEQKNNF